MTLVSVETLVEKLGSKDVVTCDVRFYMNDKQQGREEYLQSHIPGAVFVDLELDLALPPYNGARHPLPSVAQFVNVIRRLGIGPETCVVAYDSAGGAFASRLWWMLRSIGHVDVRVLDGGYQAWVRAGQPSSAEMAVPVAAEYDVPPDATWTGVVTANELASQASLGVSVIDSRAPERFRGEVELFDSRPGHIPGARDRFHGANLAPDGTHLPLRALAQRFTDLGPTPVVYCGSGVTACHNLLVMSLVGISDAQLYPGSWGEWAADATRPVALGSEPDD